jgi:hypothetical protein
MGGTGGEVRPGRKVLNLDLWARLLELINEQAYHGCEVIFWHIKARENQQARLVATRMAESGERSQFHKAFGNVGSTFLDAL